MAEGMIIIPPIEIKTVEEMKTEAEKEVTIFYRLISNEKNRKILHRAMHSKGKTEKKNLHRLLKEKRKIEKELGVHG